jgi:DNA repair protein RadC
MRLLDYLTIDMATYRRAVRVLYLDTRNRLIADHTWATARSMRAAIHPRVGRPQSARRAPPR